LIGFALAEAARVTETVTKFMSVNHVLNPQLLCEFSTSLELISELLELMQVSCSNPIRLPFPVKPTNQNKISWGEQSWCLQTVKQV